MSLCEFGCGNLATYTQKNGKKICKNNASKCPALRKKNGDGNKGRKCTWGDKLSASNKKTKATQTITAWNKGITKDQHPGMMAVSKAQKKLAEEQIQKVIPTDDPIYNNIRKYRTRIRTRSNYIYRKNKEILNPNNYTIGKFGENIYHYMQY